MMRIPQRLIQWRSLIYALFALTSIHLLLVVRFRVASLFIRPADGYAWIGVGLVIVLFLFAGSLWQFCREPLPMAKNKPSGIMLGWIILLILILAGSWMRVLIMHRYPVDSAYGDMLPLIVSASEMLLGGEFPYVTHYVPWDLPLTFMPGLWLSYVPFVWSGIDPRWLGIIALWGVSLSLYSLISNRSWAVRILGLAIIGPFIFAPAWIDFTIQGHTQVLWLYVALYGAFVLRGYYRWAAFMLGLLIISRQTFLLLVPPAVIWAFINCSRRDLLYCALCFLAPVVFVLFPFVWFDTDAVLLEPLRHYRELAVYELWRADDGYLAETPGLTYTIHRMGADSLLAFLPWAVLLLTWGGAWFYGRRAVGLLAGSGIGLFAMNLITPIPWYYIFAPPMILMGFALVGATIEARNNE